MKRLFLMICATASLALSLGDLALAQGRGQGRGQDRDDRGRGPPAERAYGRPERGPEGRRYEDPRYAPPPGYARGGYPGGGYERGGYGRADDRDDRGPGRRFDDGPRGRRDDDRGPPPDARRRYDGPPPRALAPQDARRGGYLPDRFRGGVVEDYRRFRLRPPPHGYAWVRVGNGFALVSEGTGQVFDVIPD